MLRVSRILRVLEIPRTHRLFSVPRVLRKRSCHSDDCQCGGCSAYSLWVGVVCGVFLQVVEYTCFWKTGCPKLKAYVYVMGTIKKDLKPFRRCSAMKCLPPKCIHDEKIDFCLLSLTASGGSQPTRLVAFSSRPPSSEMFSVFVRRVSSMFSVLIRLPETLVAGETCRWLRFCCAFCIFRMHVGHSWDLMRCSSVTGSHHNHKSLLPDK